MRLFNQLFLTITFFALSTSAQARTQIQQLALDAHDGERITGFIFQTVSTSDDAPLAILMHGMTGSSLYWLAQDNFASGDDVTAILLKKGYRIAALDARAHGARKQGLKPLERVKLVRQGDRDSYLEMIEDTVLDYETLLETLNAQYPETEQILAVGYSMGAQMAVLLSARNKTITHIATMVPPAVNDAPSVAPIRHAEKVLAQWLLMTANQDEFSTVEENINLAEAAQGEVTHVTYESGHLLPETYVTTIQDWLTGALD